MKSLALVHANKTKHMMLPTISKQPTASALLIDSLKIKMLDPKLNSISICATTFTSAACCNVKAVNQPNVAVAPTKPTNKAGFQAALILASSSRFMRSSIRRV